MRLRVPKRFRRLKEAKRLDEDGSGTISREELYKYIESNEKLWQMLAVCVNIPEEECLDIATDVAYQFAKKKKKQKKIEELAADELEREPTLKEIQSFLNFVKKPKGEQEFFQRTVFQAFDVDGNGYLDSNELDKFLDVFYSGIFAGDGRLPSKEELKKQVYSNCDTNGDGQLDFYEIRGLITGGAPCIASN
jgi:Ca2+-binding EF-hand superfamily protein